MKTLNRPLQLADAGLIEPEKIAALEKVVEKFSVSITTQIADLLHSASNGSDLQAKRALTAQFIPTEKELNIHPKELSDPIGDDPHQVVKGLVHRYPDRCLLLPLLTCPIFCRFCFRREKVGSEKALTQAELQTALDYIAVTDSIWEVILTGGDPLMLPPKKLAEIFAALEKIDHVEVVRIHTRIPIVDSKRIDEALLQALKIKKAVYVLVTCNHASELTETAINACAKLVDAGIPLLSQTVLLKDVNDTPEVMGALMRALVKNRIKPYYIHHGDLAKGTSHFRTTIEQGQHIMQALQGNYSGLCQPTYVLDIPGGYGKAPIGHSYIRAEECGTQASKSYEIEDFQGKKHLYKDLIEEK